MSIKAVIASQFDATGVLKAQKAFGGLSKSIKNTVGALGIGIGIAAITNGLEQATKAAIEDGKSQALLANQLRNTVSATDAQVAAVESAISSMSMMAAVADDQIRPAFASLVRATGDVGKATALTRLALDVAAGTGKDLGAVSIALGKAVNGSATSLQKLVPSIKGASDPMAVLAKQFKNAAEEAANNDPIAKLNVIFGEMQEAIGLALIPLLQDLAGFLSSEAFQKSFANLAVGIQSIGLAIQMVGKSLGIGNPFVALVDLAGAAAVGIAQIVFTLGDVATTIGMMLTGNWQGASKQMGTFFDRYNKFNDDIYKKQDAASKAAADAAKLFQNIDLTGLEDFNFEIDKNTGKLNKNKAAQQANSKARIEYWKGVKAAAEAVKAEQEALAEAQKTIASAAKDLTSVMSTTELGEFESRVVSTFDNIRQSIQSSLDSGAISKAAADGLITYVDATSKAIAAIAKQRDTLVAKRSLVEALFGDVKGSLMGAGSLSGLLEQTSKTVTKTVTSIVNGLQVAVTSTTEEITSGGLLKNFKAVLDKTKKFADQLKQLRKLGLDKNLFAEIVGAGAEAGGALANEIIAGGADAVAELNTAYKDLADVSGQIAEQTAVVMYNDGVEVAGGLVAGLLSQEQALKSAAELLANSFMTTFNNLIANMKIASSGLGTTVTKSDMGIVDYNNAINDSFARALESGQTISTSGTFGRAKGLVGSQITVNVNAGLISSPEEVGSQVNTALLAYKRSNGEI